MSAETADQSAEQNAAGDGSIDCERDGAVAVITINRPERRNALTPSMGARLRDAFTEAEADPDVWTIVLTGAGEKAFCSGGDLGNNIPDLVVDPGENLRRVVPDPTKRFFSDIYTPIIAAVNGVCVAGGTEMLLGTDIRVAASHARFGLAEVRWGIVPLQGSIIRLPRQVSWPFAMEMLLTGDLLPAERAMQIGLVNTVVDGPDVLDTAMAFAQRLCRNGPLALRAIKESAVRGLGLEAAFAQDFYLSSRVFSSEDAREGPRAFAEKREPRFRGR